MQIFTKAETRLKRQEILQHILEGSLFVYPTDTIYGMGCDATNAEAVKRVRQAKPRLSSAYSVIAPSIEWIKENCEISKEAEKWLKELPGPITLILNLKNKDCIAKEVNSGKDTLGVRIPNHWISDVVFGWFVITSAMVVAYLTLQSKTTHDSDDTLQSLKGRIIVSQ